MRKSLTFACICACSAVWSQDLAQLGQAKPVTFRGQFSAGINHYTLLSGTRPTGVGAPTPAWYLQADPVLTIYGIAVPANLLISSQESRFNGPFNRFGLSPHYKWAKAHLGWRSLNFSQFTLNGQQIMGAGLELTPGKWRAAFMYGKLNNAVTDISMFNQLNNELPLYRRMGMAAKLGYGTQKSFIEFSYLQAEDDPRSLPKGAVADSVLARPEANQVAGLNTQVALYKDLTFTLEAATSYYTRNLLSPERDTEDPWAQRANVYPRISSHLSFAGEAGLRQRIRWGNLRLKYRRVDPGFRSMGAFYMQTDLQQYTFGLDLAMLKKKLRLRSDLGLEQNNLYRASFSNSRRTIGNVGLHYLPGQTFNLSVQYTNHGISQQIIPQLQNPNTILRYDSVLISQVNRSLSIAPQLMFRREQAQHTIGLQATVQSLLNHNDLQQTPGYTSTMSSLFYSMARPKQHLALTGGLNYFSTAMGGAASTTMGINAGLSKKLLVRPDSVAGAIDAVTFSLQTGLFTNRVAGNSAGQTLSLGPSLSISMRKRHSLQINANFFSMPDRALTRNGHRDQVTLAARYNFLIG